MQLVIPSHERNHKRALVTKYYALKALPDAEVVMHTQTGEAGQHRVTPSFLAAMAQAEPLHETVMLLEDDVHLSPIVREWLPVIKATNRPVLGYLAHPSQHVEAARRNPVEPGLYGVIVPQFWGTQCLIASGVFWAEFLNYIRTQPPEHPPDVHLRTFWLARSARHQPLVAVPNFAEHAATYSLAGWRLHRSLTRLTPTTRPVRGYLRETIGPTLEPA